jgi:hypothetical protein
MWQTLQDYVLNFLSKFLVSDSADLMAIQQLSSLSTSFLPWTGPAILPSGLVKVLNLISIYSYRSIVECGSGISTVYIAKLLRQMGDGHLYSIEHDAAWAGVLQSILKREELEDYVTIVVAPLTDCELAQPPNQWYDRKAIEAKLIDTTIDLLLVDGPPANKKGRHLSRYPAVPYFQPLLSQHYAIILDDINRSGESWIMRKWESFLSLKFQTHRLDGNIAILQSSSPYSISFKSHNPLAKFLY